MQHIKSQQKTRQYVFLLLLIGIPAYADTLSLQSSDQQIGLLELYTSEGCSSCPPAEKWLNGLKNHPRLWKEFIPMAFHVDYWDYIGWKDRFASKDYSRRQKHYARTGAVRTVYTPGFVYNGAEWYVRRNAGFPEGKQTGTLQLDLNQQNIKADFKPSVHFDTALDLNIAILGFDLTTSVKAGENRNRKLEHDFVVLSMKKTPLKKQDDKYTTNTELPATNHKAPQYALIAWVSPKNRQQPLQAVGGWLKSL